MEKEDSGAGGGTPRLEDCLAEALNGGLDRSVRKCEPCKRRKTD